MKEGMGFCGGSDSKEESFCNVGDLGSTAGLGRSLEKKMATHSSILVWRIPWTEEPWSRKESDTTEQHTHTHVYMFLSYLCVCVCLLLKFSNLLFPLSHFPHLISLHSGVAFSLFMVLVLHSN